MQDYQFLFARQPIFDTNKNIVAYELLYRAGSADEAPLHDGDQATSRVLISAFSDMAIDDVVGNKKVFINFTPHLIVNPPPFDPNKLVIEVLETITITDEILAGIERLQGQRF